MADEKLTALADATAIADTDLVAMVKDMGTTPTTVARAWSLLKSTLKTYFDTLYGNPVWGGITGTLSAQTDLVAALASNRNAIINGSFAVAQRGTTFTSTSTPANSDDTYLLDRWILLSDGNDIVDVTQETSATIADPAYNIKLDVETANKKFGILQILEQKDARRLINQTVSLSFKAKITGTTIGAIRAAILSWSSTADTVTSDIVSAWEAASTNPTLVANWNYENTPAALTAPTTSWQTYEIENITIDTAAAANVAVFIWVDDTVMSAGDFLHIAEVQLELGATATPFEFRTFAQEVQLCKRYYEKSYPMGTLAGSADGYQETTHVWTNRSAGTVAYPRKLFQVEKFAAPTVTFWALDSATGAGTTARCRDENAGGLITITGYTANQIGILTISQAGNFTAGSLYAFNWQAVSEL